jgi:hypothetical protein
MGTSERLFDELRLAVKGRHMQVADTSLQNRKAAKLAKQRCGGMCEWLKQAVLKTAVRETVPGVRIPLPPPSI